MKNIQNYNGIKILIHITRGREFLNYAQKNGAVVSLSDELPQSYVLADGAVVDTVYLSELSPAAMRRRAEKMIE